MMRDFLIDLYYICNSQYTYFQGRITSEVAQLCPTLCDPMDQALPAMGFFRHEYWSGLPFPSPINVPTLSILSREKGVSIFYIFKSLVIFSRAHKLHVPFYIIICNVSTENYITPN